MTPGNIRQKDTTFSDIYVSGVNHTQMVSSNNTGINTDGTNSQMNKTNPNSNQPGNTNYRHLSNKSDSNLNSNSNNSTFVGNAKTFEKVKKE